PDAKTVAAGGRVEPTLRLYDRVTGKQLRSFGDNPGPTSALSSSPDGKTLAAADKEPTVQLWSVATGEEWHHLKDRNIAVDHLLFAPDGKMVAAAKDSIVYLWDVTTGKLLGRFDNGEAVHCLAFNSDGKLLAL